MREPGYRERSTGELRRALRWSRKKLWLGGWTIELLVDRADKDTDLAEYRAKGNAAGSVWYPSQCHAVIGVWRENGEDTDTDPLFALFHEVGHIATNWQVSPKTHSDTHEFFLSTVAGLLLELWERERDGASD